MLCNGNNSTMCEKMKTECESETRFSKMPDGEILSIRDLAFINYCPYCGGYVGGRN